MTKITISRRPRRTDESWLSSWTAWRGFLLIGTGLLLMVFQQWLGGALGIAVGIWGLLYARRKFGGDRSP